MIINPENQASNPQPAAPAQPMQAPVIPGSPPGVTWPQGPAVPGVPAGQEHAEQAAPVASPIVEERPLKTADRPAKGTQDGDFAAHKEESSKQRR